MKKIIVFIGFLIIMGNWAFAQEEPLAKISFFTGNVRVKRDTTWIDAKVNLKLSAMDSIQTMKDSRAEIKFADQGIIRLDENSLLEISELLKEEDTFQRKTKLMLGNIWIHVKGLIAEKDVFETTSPTAVAAVRGTVYRMGVMESTATDVYVYHGRVEVKPWRMPVPQKKAEGESPWGNLTEIEGPKEITMEEWTVLVQEMQKVSIPADSAAAPVVEDFTAESDSANPWVQWNKERDQAEFGE